MTDREKVIKALGCFCSGEEEKPDDCPCEFRFKNEHDCGSNVAREAIALLKEQEAIKPTWSCGKPYCGSCGLRIRSGGKFCSECGAAIAWEGR